MPTWSKFDFFYHDKQIDLKRISKYWYFNLEIFEFCIRFSCPFPPSRVCLFQVEPRPEFECGEFGCHKIQMRWAVWQLTRETRVYGWSWGHRCVLLGRLRYLWHSSKRGCWQCRQCWWGSLIWLYQCLYWHVLVQVLKKWCMHWSILVLVLVCICAFIGLHLIVLGPVN